jgi:hypothetical protein
VASCFAVARYAGLSPVASGWLRQSPRARGLALGYRLSPATRVVARRFTINPRTTRFFELPPGSITEQRLLWFLQCFTCTSPRTLYESPTALMNVPEQRSLNRGATVALSNQSILSGVQRGSTKMVLNEESRTSPGFERGGIETYFFCV